MGNQACQLVVAVEYHAVSTGATATVDLVRAQNGEFIVGAIHGEAEALVVVVLVRVLVLSESLAGLVELITLVLRGRDIAGPVAGAAAGVDARVAVFEGRGEGDNRRKEESSDGEDLDGVRWRAFLDRVPHWLRGASVPE